MASDRGGAVRRAVALIAVGLPLLGYVSLTSSCDVLQRILPSAAPAPRPFNHKAHLERGPDCLVCHENAEAGVKAGMPSRETCWLCHEELDGDPGKPLEKKVAWFEDEEKTLRWSSFTKQSSEIIFSHKVHAEKLISCRECHLDMEKDTGLLPGKLQRMASCRSCHEEQAPKKTDCATCHRTIRRDVPPPDHHQGWDKRHGLCSRQGAEVSSSFQCSLCHERDACTTCHQTRPPDDHNTFWRLRAHGIASSIDRSRCQTCHTSDSCVRCHQETAPRSHTAGWNAPRNRHCIGCHEPLQASGSCFVCHKSAPGHTTANVMPAWHLPNSNCRACHAATLKHPDNGGKCTYCHR